jgi:hypothetical protein
MSNQAKSYHDLVDAETKIDGPHGWVQWKGTEVCMDVHCACGAHLHVDASFAYAVGCPHCGKVYAASPYIRLVELTDPAHIAYAKSGSFIPMEPDENRPIAE